MKKQIITIHDGTTFDTHEDYISYLRNKELPIEKLKEHKDWKSTLTEKLGDDFEVLSPRMPNSTNARYEEWKIWFEKIISISDENIILVGHSLGGIFLAKYFSENTVAKTIKTTILVAAPFDDTDDDEPLTDFKLPLSLEKFEQQGGDIYLIQSKDDPVVPFEQVKKYEKALPNASIIIFDDREHFNQEIFPEIIKLIKSN